MWPIEKYEKTLRDKYDSELPKYLNDKLALEKPREHVTEARQNNNRDAMKAALDALGPAPATLSHPMLTCPAYEGLYKLFATSQPSLLAHSLSGEAGHCCTRLYRRAQPHQKGAALLRIGMAVLSQHYV
jgi:hypothetical protein